MQILPSTSPDEILPPQAAAAGTASCSDAGATADTASQPKDFADFLSSGSSAQSTATSVPTATSTSATTAGSSTSANIAPSNGTPVPSDQVKSANLQKGSTLSRFQKLWTLGGQPLMQADAAVVSDKEMPAGADTRGQPLADEQSGGDTSKNLPTDPLALMLLASALTPALQPVPIATKPESKLDLPSLSGEITVSNVTAALSGPRGLNLQVAKSFGDGSFKGDSTPVVTALGLGGSGQTSSLVATNASSTDSAAKLAVGSDKSSAVSEQASDVYAPVVPRTDVTGGDNPQFSNQLPSSPTEAVQVANIAQQTTGDAGVKFSQRSSEKIAPMINAPSASKAVDPKSTLKKSFLSVDKESLTKASSAVGITGAKQGANMFTDDAKPQDTASSAVLGLSSVNAVGSIGTHDAGQASSSNSTSNSVSEPKLAAVITEILKANDRVGTNEKTSVDLHFNFGAHDHLSVRVEWRGGVVHTTFQTNSAELRDTLTSTWRDYAPQAAEKPYRFAEPVFSSSNNGGFSAQTNGDGSRQRQFADRASSGFSFPSSSGTSEKSSSSDSAPSTATAAVSNNSSAQLYAFA
ncbi:MAG TPA: hypothetical protein VKC60_16940 [Opitutaceae bacterium]|nr:hypothetical protein [Opitutaceae bacterium]